MTPFVWVRNASQGATQRRRCSRRAFTLIDVLVSLAVMAVLIGLMLPALTAIRETSRKVVCSSNIRQIGLSTAMYADDYKHQLPYSLSFDKFVYNTGFVPQSLMKARLGQPSDITAKWDGLGVLYGGQYCSAPQVYYCPSHKSYHRFENYAGGWSGAPTEVFINYQYRGGEVRAGQPVRNLDMIRGRISLVADGMASEIDFNHGVGGNVIVSDLSVAWFDDSTRSLQLPLSYSDPNARDKLLEAWMLIDVTVSK
ncbi:MAG: DUF1559 domain-containing protein [Phycisphaerales bacterium]|nr:DUF1559 domain-containing protein [Phycisphaerales bacterium]